MLSSAVKPAYAASGPTATAPGVPKSIPLSASAFASTAPHGPLLAYAKPAFAEDLLSSPNMSPDTSPSTPSDVIAFPAAGAAPEAERDRTMDDLPWYDSDNFAAVLEAAAEDHAFSYCESTPASLQAVAAAASTHLAALTKGAAVVPCTAVPAGMMFGKSAGLSAIEQFWAKPSSPKPAPKLNLANSKLFRRRFGAASEAQVAGLAFCAS